ncbi:MAG: TolC family protein [Bacteroidales bacterium]|nr:TolC family protein [Bacteroidales bacterium]
MRKIFRAFLVIASICITAGAASNAEAAENSARKNTDTLSPQKVWTLKQCTDYALENNVALQQSKLDADNAAIDVKTAKAAKYPSLSASVGQNYSGNYFNNGASEKNTYSGSYGVSANWTLYKGGYLNDNVKQTTVTQQIQDLTYTKNRLDLKVTVAQYYVQVLYDIENIKIRQEAAASSKVQWDRGKEFLKAGNMSKADCAKLEAQYNADNYQLVTAQSTYDSDMVNLKNALKLEREEMSIITPEISESKVLETIPDRNGVFAKAMNLRPEIEISQLYIKNSELELAKAKYTPTISLNASSGTNNISGTGTNYGKQLKTNWTNTVGVTLSIPIYSNRTYKSATEKAKNDISYYKLAAEQTENDMYKTIDNLYLNAKNTQQQYISAKESYRSAKESYDLVCEQFNLGMKNIVELEQEKSTYLAAEQEVAQTKYMALYNLQVLKFYTGEEIDI